MEFRYNTDVEKTALIVDFDILFLLGIGFTSLATLYSPIGIICATYVLFVICISLLFGTPQLLFEKDFEFWKFVKIQVAIVLCSLFAHDVIPDELIPTGLIHLITITVTIFTVFYHYFHKIVVLENEPEGTILSDKYLDWSMNGRKLANLKFEENVRQLITREIDKIDKSASEVSMPFFDKNKAHLGILQISNIFKDCKWEEPKIGRKIRRKRRITMKGLKTKIRINLMNKGDTHSKLPDLN